LRGRGRASEARDVLAPIRACFTESVDLPDLVAATALLGEPDAAASASPTPPRKHDLSVAADTAGRAVRASAQRRRPWRRTLLPWRPGRPGRRDGGGTP
jgi:hypothetical protein